MKQRYWLFKRGGVFYVQDTETGQQSSLDTRDSDEAKRIRAAKNEATARPTLGLTLARAYLAAYDPQMVERTWTQLMEMFCATGGPSTQAMRRKVLRRKPFNLIRKRRITETTADHLRVVLASGGVMVNHTLRCLHNLAIGMGWLPWPIIPSKLWPKPETKPKRGITASEHQRIIEAERNEERRCYYELLWEIGAGQSDAANLTAENIDWTRMVLAYQRMKTHEWSYLSIGSRLATLLKKLPLSGRLFPKIAQHTDRDRAAEFRRRCRLLGINGVSLHSYRYAWAERAQAAGMPERFSQLALGHASKAVHRAYAKNANVVCPSLDQYERSAKPATPLQIPISATNVV
jgi:integrase